LHDNLIFVKSINNFLFVKFFNKIFLVKNHLIMPERKMHAHKLLPNLPEIPTLVWPKGATVEKAARF
jgi:hypothetical protein